MLRDGETHFFHWLPQIKQIHIIRVSASKQNISSRALKGLRIKLNLTVHKYFNLWLHISTWRGHCNSENSESYIMRSFHNLYSSPSIVRIIKSRMIWWTGHVPWWRKWIMCSIFWLERDHLGDLGIDERILQCSIQSEFNWFKTGISDTLNNFQVP